MSKQHDDDLLTASEVIRLLHISRPTLYNWDKRGVLRPIPASPALQVRHRLYRRADVERLMPPPAQPDQPVES